MKIYFLLAASLFGLSTAVQAQSNFRPGYVLPLTGDTLRGQVDYRSGQRNARFCRFQPAAGPVAQYGPNELRGYGFSGLRHYHAHPVMVPDSVGSPARRYFVEQLMPGPVPLYYRQDPNGTDHFYVGRIYVEAITELVQRTQLVTVNNVTRPQEKNLYRGTLAEVLADCPAVQMQVGSLAFRRTDLIRLLEQYNACMGYTETTPASARQRSRFGLEVLGGVEQSQLTFEGTATVADGRFNSGQRPAGGLGLRFTAPALSEKLSFRVEALYEQQQFDDEYVTYTGYIAGAQQQAHFTLTYLRIPLLLRYTYPKGRVRPFLQAGISYALARRTDNEYRARSLFGTTSYGPYQPVFEPKTVRRYEQGYLGSLGVELPGPARHPLTVEVRVERSNGFLDTSDIKSSLLRFYGLVGYSLTK